MRFSSVIMLAASISAAHPAGAQAGGSGLQFQRPGRSDQYLVTGDTAAAGSRIPVSVINGAQPGPTFTIVAGIHGFEYPPIVAVQELLREIDPAKLKGRLIILPLASPASFYGRSPFLHPQDRRNLNNAFPGRSGGSATEQIADAITRTIIPLSDVFLDIHGGDAGENLLPFVCYYDNRNKPAQTTAAAALCEASGFEHIVSYPYTLSDSEPAKYAFKQAVQDGKIALSIEAGELGQVQPEAVAKIKAGVYAMLQARGHYRGEMTAPKQKTHFNRQSYAYAPVQGYFRSTFSAGDQVQKDAVIGTISDLFGTELASVLAPATGTILYKTQTPPLNKGETVICVGYWE